MTGRSRRNIYVLEREPQSQTVLETELGADEASVTGFSGPQECLDRLTARPCDLLIINLDGGALDGLHVLRQARQIAPWISSLAIVEHAAIPCAIKALRAGVGDCLDKPVPQDRLLAAVRLQLARVDASRRRRPRALTRMEVQILRLILAGRTSHEIAAELHRSKRTVDVHRKNIMRKSTATGLVDLIRRAFEMGFSDGPERPSDEPGPQPHDDAVDNATIGTGPTTGA